MKGEARSAGAGHGGLRVTRRALLIALALTPAVIGAGPGAKLPPLVFYWGVGCPHCEEALPFILSLEQEGIVVDRVEVRQNLAGRERFIADVKRLGIAAPGIPLFVLGDHYVMGFVKGATEEQVRAMIRSASRAGA